MSLITNIEADICESIRKIHALMEATQKEIAWLGQVQTQAKTDGLWVTETQLEHARGELRQSLARLALATQKLRGAPLQ